MTEKTIQDQAESPARVRVAALVLVALVAVVHGPAVPNAFVYDDFAAIRDNPAIGPWANIPLLFTQRYFKISRELSYRPAATLSYFLDYTLWGVNAWGFHLTDKVIHAANVVLAFLLLRGLLANVRAAFLAAAFFAVHPLTTEALNVPGFREDPLAVCFMLVASLAYVAGRVKRDAETRGRGDTGARQAAPLRCSLRGLLRLPSTGWVALAVSALYLGLLCKEVALVFPGLVLVYDYCAWRNGERISLRGALARSALFAAAMAPYLVVRFGLMRNPQEATLGYLGGDRVSAVTTSAVVLCYYVRLAAMPVPLAAEYRFPTLQELGLGTAAAGGVALLLVAGLLVARARRSSGVAFGAGWWALTIAPVANLVPIANPVAERYLYAPTLGLCALLGLGFAALLRPQEDRPPRLPRMGLTVCALVVALFAGLTLARNRQWRNERHIYADTIRKCRSSERFHVNLAVVLRNMGRPEQAEAEYLHALRIKSDDADVCFQLGNLYANQGMHGSAVRAYTACLKRSPDHALAHHKIACSYTILRRYHLAVRHFREALRLGYREAAKNLRIVEDWLRRHGAEEGPEDRATPAR